MQPFLDKRKAPKQGAFLLDSYVKIATISHPVQVGPKLRHFHR
jgi:hypothetical protein